MEPARPSTGPSSRVWAEHNDIGLLAPGGDDSCCGAPWLPHGRPSPIRTGREEGALRPSPSGAGRADVIVTQPTCAYIVKNDYPIYALGPDADLIRGAHLAFDPVRVPRSPNTAAKVVKAQAQTFPGPGHMRWSVPATTYSWHLRPQNIDCRGRRSDPADRDKVWG